MKCFSNIFYKLFIYMYLYIFFHIMAYKIECIKNTIIEALLYSYKCYLYISRTIRLIVFIFRE